MLRDHVAALLLQSEEDLGPFFGKLRARLAVQHAAAAPTEQLRLVTGLVAVRARVVDDELVAALYSLRRDRRRGGGARLAQVVVLGEHQLAPCCQAPPASSALLPGSPASSARPAAATATAPPPPPPPSLQAPASTPGLGAYCSAMTWLSTRWIRPT